MARATRRLWPAPWLGVSLGIALGTSLGVCLATSAISAHASTVQDSIAQESSETLESPSKKIAVAVNPLALLFGIFGMEVHAALAPTFTVGAGFQTAEANFTNRNTQIYEYGLSAAYYLTGQAFETAWSIRPGVRYMPVENVSTVTGVESLAESVVLSVVLNRQWSWGPGFHAALGLGAALDVNNPGRRFQPRMLAQFGWAW